SAAVMALLRAEMGLLSLPGKVRPALAQGTRHSAGGSFYRRGRRIGLQTACGRRMAARAAIARLVHMISVVGRVGFVGNGLHTAGRLRRRPLLCCDFLLRLPVTGRSILPAVQDKGPPPADTALSVHHPRPAIQPAAGPAVRPPPPSARPARRAA